MDLKLLSYDYLVIVFLLTCYRGVVSFEDDYDDTPSFGRCPWIRNKLKNGRVKLRSRGRIAKFLCDPGYELAGKRFATCVRGQWNNPIPVCVARGCSRKPPIRNGRITEMYRGAMLVYDCNPGYTLDGSVSIHCDGRRWNTDPPSCVVTTSDPETLCDFEDPDLCGWSHDPTHDFDWKRNQFSTPSGHVGTGPSFDHTFGKGKGGFYLYLEASSPRKENDTSRLFSPVYPSDFSGGCFIFWYHMYGATTGGMRVYLKPESHVFGELSPTWEKFGDQGNQWLRGHIPINHLHENFQLVIEGIRGSSYVSDSAIDDVQLTKLDCASMENATDTVENTVAESCRGRCREPNDPEDEQSCQCTENCLKTDRCCNDYATICTAGNDTIGDNPDESLPVEELGTTKSLVTVGVITSTQTESTETDTKPSVTLTKTETITEASVAASTTSSSISYITSYSKPLSTSVLPPTSTASPASTVPSTSIVPSTSTQPSTSTLPSTSTQPSTSTLPSTSTQPSTSSPLLSSTLRPTSRLTSSSTLSSTFKLESTSTVSSTTTTLSTILPKTQSEFITVGTDSLPFTTAPNTISSEKVSSVTKLTTQSTVTSSSLNPITESITTPTTHSTMLYTTKNDTEGTLSVSTSTPLSTKTTMESTSHVSYSFSGVNLTSTVGKDDSSSTTSPTSTSSTRKTYNLRPRTKKTTPYEQYTSFNSISSTPVTATSSTTNQTISSSSKIITNTFKSVSASSTTKGTTLPNVVIWGTTRPSSPSSTRHIALATVTTPKTLPTTKIQYWTQKTKLETVVLTTLKESAFRHETTPGSASSRTSKATPTESNSSKPIVTIVSICVVGLICGAVGLMYYLKKQKTKRQSKLSDDSEMRFLSENEVMEYSDPSVLDKILVK